MNPVKFSTYAVAAPRQLDAWKEWFDTLFELKVPGSETGFAAKSVHWMLDGMAFSRVSAPALEAIRSKALLRRNPIDHWAITIGKQRTRGIVGDDGSLDVPAGTPFVASLGRELTSQRTRDERLQLYLPRDTFGELAPVLDAAQGQALNTPMGRLLGDYIVLLERSLGDLTEADLPRLTNAVRAMVLACLASSDNEDAASQIHVSRRERARQIVLKNLSSASFSPETLCREMGTSRSQLYRLLANDGGVAQFIQRLRLLQAHTELADRSNLGSIKAIAESLCFPDGSSFTRAFRQEFGVSPSDVRAAALTGYALDRKPRTDRGSEFETLADCLRYF